MTTPNAFVAEAVISGGVSDTFNKSIRDAVVGVRGMRRSTTELTRDLRTQQNGIRRIERNLRRATEEWERTEEGSRASVVAGRRVNALNRQLRVAGRNVHELQNELREASERGVSGFERLRAGARAARGAFIALGAAGGAALGAMTLAIRETFQDVDELTRITFRAPGIDLSEADSFKRAEGIYKISAESMARSLQTLQREVGEFQTGVDELQAQYLADAGVDISDFVGLEGIDLLNAGIDALRGLSTESERAAAAGLLFGRGGGAQLTNLSLILDQLGVSTAEFGEQIRSEFSNDQLQRIADAEGAFGNLALATTDLRRAFTLGLSGYLQTLGVSLEGATKATTDYLKSNEGAAPLLAGVAGGLATAGAAGLALGGGLGELGQQAFFASHGFKAVTTAGSAASGVLPLLGSGFKAVALGISGATKAAIAFAFTPIGAAIVGITAAAAGLAIGVKYLSDKVGGFGNLWSITLAGAKAGFLEFANLITFNFRIIGKGVDALIGGFNAFARILPGVGEIDFRAGRLFEDLDAARADARAEFDRRLASGRADAAARRRGAGSGGAGAFAAGLGVSGAPRLADETLARRGLAAQPGASGGGQFAAPAPAPARQASAGGGHQQITIDIGAINIAGADGQSADDITSAVAAGIGDALQGAAAE